MLYYHSTCEEHGTVKQSIHSHLGARATRVGKKYGKYDLYFRVVSVDSHAIHFFYRNEEFKLFGRRNGGVTISELMINEQIRDKEVRVLGLEGEQLGVMPTKDAMKLAEDAGVDLIKIAPTAKPPVCRIMDYGKYRYEQSRREKEAKKKQRVIEIKEVRLSPNIDDNDLNTKANMARKFLEKGDKVKVTLRFRGRELAHTANGKAILDQFAETLSDIAVIEKPAKFEGRSMIMFLAQKR